MATLKTTLWKVTQTEGMAFRQQLRQTLHQHCTVHIPAPPGFRCHAAQEDCTCLQVTQRQSTHINIEQDTPTSDAQAQDLEQESCTDTPLTAEPATSLATDRTTMEADLPTPSDPQ